MHHVSVSELAALIGTHLPGIAALVVLERDAGGWRVAESLLLDAGGGAPQPPDDAVLDFAARAGRPTYLPQGEEGSDFCLLDARSTLYLPLSGGRRLLFVTGKTADSFSHAGVQAAWRALSAPHVE